MHTKISYLPIADVVTLQSVSSILLKTNITLSDQFKGMLPPESLAGVVSMTCEGVSVVTGDVGMAFVFTPSKITITKTIRNIEDVMAICPYNSKLNDLTWLYGIYT